LANSEFAKFVGFDAATGELVVDYGAAETAMNSMDSESANEFGDAFNDYIDEFQGYADQYQENMSIYEDYMDSMQELMEMGQEEYQGMLESVRDAIES
jgi:hypothetical protein